MKKTKRNTIALATVVALTVTIPQYADAALLAHWTFDEAGDVDAADSSGNGYDLTRNAGTTISSGKSGNAYSTPRFVLDATDSVAVKNGGGSTITLSAWVTVTPTNGFQGIAGFENTGFGQDVYSLKYDGTSIAWTVDGSSLVTSTDTLNNYAAATSDGWVHLVGVFEQGVGNTLYVNGVADNTGAATNAIETDTSTFAVGSYQGGTAYRFGGSIDDVQVYDNALTASDVTFLFNNAGTALVVVPEPSSSILLGLGGIALILRRRK